jgi:hypothetical protein
MSSLAIQSESDFAPNGLAPNLDAGPAASMPPALQQIGAVGAALEERRAGPALQLTARQYLEHYSEPFRALGEEQKKSICEFLRRVDKEELSGILREIQALPAFPEEGASDLTLLKFALRDFIAGELDVWTMSAVFLHDACLNGDPNRERVRMMGLFIDGERNEAAITILKRAATRSNSIYRYYSGSQIEELLTDPEVEQEHIYMVPIPKKDNIVKVIAEELDYPFLTLEEKDGLYQVVLSPRLMQKLLHLKFKEQAVRINPVLGPSVAFRNFENAAQRDVLVPCRVFPRSHPKEADRHPASPLQFYHHDIAFHAYIVANIPRKHREAFIELAALFEGTKDNCLHKLRFHLLDQEFRDYLHGERSIDPSVCFKAALGQAWLDSGIGESGLRTVQTHIKQHAERWETDYGIVFNHDIEDPYDWLAS